LGALGLAGAIQGLSAALDAPPRPLLLWSFAAPWAWLSLLPGLGLLAALSAHRLRALPLGLGVLIWSAIWGRVWLPMPDRAEGPALTVMSWNVQRLLFEDRPDSPSMRCVVEEIQREDPEALVLLEVSARDVQRLEQTLGMSCGQVDYWGTGGEGRGGVAACARGPDWRLRSVERPRYVDSIDWHYAMVELESTGAHPQVLNLLAVHLQPYRMAATMGLERLARSQVEETAGLLRRVKTFRDPTIVAGDFNSPRDSAVHVQMRRTMRDSWEVAGWGPGGTVQALGLWPLRVDYLYASRDFGIAGARITGATCADHQPILARLLLPR
jgi:endonuclease/exonuclease/phosphatase (EEP) superfamily protein YafD